jgi:FAD:protein FMN transferase
MTCGTTLILLALVTFTSSGLANGTGEDLHVARRWLMGTEMRLVIVGAHARAEDVAERCFALVADLEESLSTWIPESPLSRINARAGERVVVSDMIADYLDRCLEDHRRTEGAFDPSVGTWRGIDDPAQRPRIGLDRIEVERTAEGNRVRLPFAGFALDSGGNGKGIAVDRVVEELRRSGVHTALVDFGGSSWYGLGAPPDGEAWIVTVPVPGSARDVRLRDRALSVSATHLDDADGSRRVHIFDPRTGTAIEVERVAIVTSPSAEDAEVLSTVLVVDGEKGLHVLERYEAAEGIVLEASARD